MSWAGEEKDVMYDRFHIKVFDTINDNFCTHRLEIVIKILSLKL